jgi:hypothetical protein
MTKKELLTNVFEDISGFKSMDASKIFEETKSTGGHHCQGRVVRGRAGE